jgi:hypothetical protein
MGEHDTVIESDFLVAQPSILYGLARFFDFAGAFDSYNHSRTVSEADARAMFADWYITGADLVHALEAIKSDPSCGEDSRQLSLFTVSAKSQVARELQETA